MKHHLPEKSTTVVEVWMVLGGIFCSVDWEKSKGEADNTRGIPSSTPGERGTLVAWGTEVLSPQVHHSSNVPDPAYTLESSSDALAPSTCF